MRLKLGKYISMSSECFKQKDTHLEMASISSAAAAGKKLKPITVKTVFEPSSFSIKDTLALRTLSRAHRDQFKEPENILNGLSLEILLSAYSTLRHSHQTL